MVNDNNDNTVQGAVVETPEVPAETPVAESVQGADEPQKIDFSQIMGQFDAPRATEADDDIVSKVRDFRKQGLSPDEIAQRLSVGAMDFSKMSPFDKIVQKTMIETKLDRQTVEEALRDTYGEEDARSAAQRLRLAQDAQQAEGYLSNMAVKTQEKPVAEPVDNTKIKDNWSMVGDSILAATKSIPFSVKDKDLDYTGNFNIPEDILKQIKPLMVDFAVNNGLPFTQESAEKLQSFAENLVFVSSRKQIIETYIRDAYAKGLEKGAALGTGGNIVKRENAGGSTGQDEFAAKVLAKMEGR